MEKHCSPTWAAGARGQRLCRQGYKSSKSKSLNYIMCCSGLIYHILLLISIAILYSFPYRASHAGNLLSLDFRRFFYPVLLTRVESDPVGISRINLTSEN